MLNGDRASFFFGERQRAAVAHRGGCMLQAAASGGYARQAGVAAARGRQWQGAVAGSRAASRSRQQEGAAVGRASSAGASAW